MIMAVARKIKDGKKTIVCIHMSVWGVSSYTAKSM
jgi:hypothetical protein